MRKSKLIEYIIEPLTKLINEYSGLFNHSCFKQVNGKDLFFDKDEAGDWEGYLVFKKDWELDFDLTLYCITSKGKTEYCNMNFFSSDFMPKQSSNIIHNNLTKKVSSEFVDSHDMDLLKRITSEFNKLKSKIDGINLKKESKIKELRGFKKRYLINNKELLRQSLEQYSLEQSFKKEEFILEELKTPEPELFLEEKSDWYTSKINQYFFVNPKVIKLISNSDSYDGGDYYGFIGSTHYTTFLSLKDFLKSDSDDIRRIKTYVDYLVSQEIEMPKNLFKIIKINGVNGLRRVKAYLSKLYEHNIEVNDRLGKEILAYIVDKNVDDIRMPLIKEAELELSALTEFEEDYNIDNYQKRIKLLEIFKKLRFQGK